MAYKVVQKYVEPRLMKYSELPVGQVFARSDESESRPSSGYVYLKIRHERMPGNALVIKEGGSGGVRVGDSLTFNDGNMKYYAVTMEYNWGELLVVPSEKK